MESVSRKRMSPAIAVVATRGSRKCGDCRMCCLTHGVHTAEFQKEAGSWCACSKKGVGCVIYKNRPKNCVEFECEWLKGAGEELHRPDLTGVVLDYVVVEDGLLKELLQIYEAELGALSSDYVKQIALFSLGVGTPVLFVYLNKRQVVYVPRSRPNIRRLLGRAENQGAFEIGSFKDLVR